MFKVQSNYTDSKQSISYSNSMTVEYFLNVGHSDGICNGGSNKMEFKLATTKLGTFHAIDLGSWSFHLPMHIFTVLLHLHQGVFDDSTLHMHCIYNPTEINTFERKFECN